MSIVRLGLNFQPTVMTSGASYNMTNEDVLVVNKGTGSATTVNLPKVGNNTTPPTNPLNIGHTVFIKDGKGDGAAHNITIQDPNGYTIDGAASLVISTNYGKAALMWNGTQWNQLV